MNVLHVPFGGIAGHELLREEGQLPAVVLAMIYSFLLLPPLSFRAGHRHGRRRLFIARHVWTLAGLSVTRLRETWRGFWAHCACLSAGILDKNKNKNQFTRITKTKLLRKPVLSTLLVFWPLNYCCDDGYWRLSASWGSLELAVLEKDPFALCIPHYTFKFEDKH